MLSPQTFFVGAKALIIEKDAVLILEDQGFHDLPGGRIDKDENAIEALERELIEELPGIDSIEVGPLVGWHRPFDYSDDGNGLFLVVFLTQARIPDPVRISHEHDRAHWYPVSQARSILASMAIDWSRID